MVMGVSVSGVSRQASVRRSPILLVLAVLSWQMAFAVFWCRPNIASETVVSPDDWQPRFVVEDLPGLSAIAARPNGQSILAIDRETRSVVAFESDEPSRRRTVLAPPEAAAEPIALACIDSSTVALLVATTEGTLELRSYRLQPSGEAPGTSTAIQAQIVPGWGRVEAERRVEASEASLAVSPGRDWLVLLRRDRRLFGTEKTDEAVVPILRSPIAGSRLGPLGPRHCPGRSASAVAVSPAGELVLLEPSETAVELVLYSRLQGHELLRLPTGLIDVRAVTYGRDGNLWAAAKGGAGSVSGVWRLDSSMRDGRQGVRATCVTLVDNPVAIASAGDGRLALLSGIAGKRKLAFLAERSATPAATNDR